MTDTESAERTYADATTTIDAYRDDVTSKHRTLPLGSLLIVDDDHALTADQAALARPQRRRHQHQTPAHRHPRRTATRPHAAHRLG